MNTVPYVDFIKALYAMQDRIDQSGEVNVFNKNLDGFVGLGVSWASIGTCSVDRAKEFSEKLLRAIAEVENFPYNGFEIIF